MEVNGLTCTPRLPPTNKKAAHDVVRPLADYHPTVWGEFFIHSLPPTDVEHHAWMQERAEKLKEEVRTMLSDGHQLTEEMDLVDALQRLGLANHFDKEISEALVRIHGSQLSDTEDLHVVSLRFRLLRQEGYNVSSDVFNRFKDADGHFRGSLSSDVKGLLSLYEAANLGTRSDAVLDEAITFCRDQLQPMLDHLQPHLAAEVARALELPVIRRIRRLEIRQYLSFYELASEVRNDLILELAKLDFNLLQSLHQEELRSLTRWWTKLGIINKLTYARDRLVECYFWMLGVQYEPHFAAVRKTMTKVICFLSLLDDTYDAYGTLEELKLLTDVIERWDIGAAEGLPEYMKAFFAALSQTIQELQDELLQDENLFYRTQFLKGEFAKQAKAYLKEAEWRTEGHVPTLEEHLHVTLRSGGTTILTCASFYAMGDIATKEAFDWLTTRPRIVEASSIIGRIMGDIASYKFEEQRQHVASVVQCYMKEYGVSEDIACQKLIEMVDLAWKDTNEEWIEHAQMPLPLLIMPVHLARVIEMYYKHSDGYTHSSKATKDVINSLLVKCIPV